MRHTINAETVIRGFEELIRRAINAETVIPEKVKNRPDQKIVHTSRVPRFRKISKIGPEKNSSHFSGSQILENVKNRPGKN